MVDFQSFYYLEIYKDNNLISPYPIFFNQT